MIVVATIAAIAAIAVPSFYRARKRSQASIILEDLRILAAAVDQYAIETQKSPGATATWSDVRAYLKTGSRIYEAGGNDLFGAAYVGFTVDSVPKLRTSSFDKVSDVAPLDFWSPFYP
ncbi:MAG: prepilin-type cleavage/methylation domain-containing protein [Chthoniobacteraceae bacterium]